MCNMLFKLSVLKIIEKYVSFSFHIAVIHYFVFFLSHTIPTTYLNVCGCSCTQCEKGQVWLLLEIILFYKSVQNHFSERLISGAMLQVIVSDDYNN